MCGAETPLGLLGLTPVKGFFPLSEIRKVYCIMEPAEGKSYKSKQSLSGTIKKKS